MNSRYGMNRRIHTSLVGDSRSVPAPRQMQEDAVTREPDVKPVQEDLPAPLRESEKVDTENQIQATSGTSRIGMGGDGETEAPPLHAHEHKQDLMHVHVRHTC